MLRSSVLRASTSSRSALLSASLPRAVCVQQVRAAHAISNPTLANIEKRWEAMPPQEQADLWMSLRDRMKSDWHELTLQEKKASYWIAFGPHGPRAQDPPGENARVFWYTIAGVGVSFLFFWAIRAGSRDVPSTMTKEYQEQSNEFLQNQKSEPITGFASEGYSGKGMVQSPPEKLQKKIVRPE